MIICGTDRIDPNDGWYLLLSDMGTEGLVVTGQFHSVYDALQALGRPGGYDSLVLVALANVGVRP